MNRITQGNLLKIAAGFLILQALIITLSPAVRARSLNVDLRLMLNESRRYVGDLLFKSGEVERAAAHYRKELALTREMVAADPANAQFRRNEAIALIKVGDVEAQNGRTANALANYNEGLRLREQLSASAPQDLSLQRELDEVRNKLRELKRG